MSDEGRQSRDFETTKARLAEIADAVSDENLSLDDALDLFEEAVALGLQASDLLETGIVVPADDELGNDSSDGSKGADDAVGTADTGMSAHSPMASEND